MKIVWSHLAKIDYWKNIEYLEENWTFTDVVNFINEVELLIDLLKANNVTFLKTNYKNVCKVVLNKQITLYYFIDNKTITLLRFWNNYQDLDNFKLK